MKKKQQGFSLVELLIVVGIIGVITAIAVPAYIGHKDKAHATAALTSLKTVLSGATLALDEGTDLEDYIDGLTDAEDDAYTIDGLGKITADTDALIIALADGQSTPGTITYTLSENLWDCSYTGLKDNITKLSGCKEVNPE